MRTITQHLLFCCTALALTGCSQQPTPTPAETLEARLRRCVEHGLVLFGHQDGLFYGKHWNRWDAGHEQSDIRAVAGDYPAVLGVEIGGIELGDSLSLDRVPFRLIREGIAEHHRRGGIVTVSWHAANPLTGGDAWDVENASGTVAALLEGGSRHALAREWLSRVGDFLASLRDDNGEPIPVIWRPWHEMAGGWFWWGAPYCSPEEYKELWHMTCNYLCHEKGLTNLLWAISPGFTDQCDTGYTEYYPGDDCVDLIGIDIYQYGSDEAFRTLTQQHLTTLADMARTHGKLLALTETGYEAIPNPAWWTETLFPALNDVPVAYVLLWRNAWDRENHYYAPFEGEASAADFKVFAGNSRIGLLDDLNALEE